MGAYALGGIGIVGVVVLACMGIWAGVGYAQKKREAELILEQQSHEARLAMIERGMTPPSETPMARAKNLNAVYGVLSGMGCLPPLFAFFNGSTAAWLCAGTVGLASVIALVIIYLKNASLGNP